MSSLAITLKDEIRRLARKEIRQQTSPAIKTMSRQRREIAQLKKTAQHLEKRLNHALREQRRSDCKAPSGHTKNGQDATGISEGTRFSARSLKAQRRNAGLSAAGYAKLIGVTPLTIYNWEQGKTRPRRNHMPRIVALRGVRKREAQQRLEELAGANGRKPRGVRKTK